MKFGLLGATLGHSLSPQIHKMVFEELGLNHTYELLELQEAEVLPFLSRAAEEYGGFNVTIPYKVKVMEALKTSSLEAKAIGAVNTILFRKGEGYGYNTDYFGFSRMLDFNKISVTDKRVVLLGNGGAAKAVLQYLLNEGAGSIKIVARSVEGAKEKLVAFMDRGEDLEVISQEDFRKNTGGDIIINTTPVGMAPHMAASPVEAQELEGYEAAVDLIYNPEETLFLRQAKLRGCQTCNGMYMLVAQAIASEEIWLERKLPDSLIAKIAAAMQDSLCKI